MIIEEHSRFPFGTYNEIPKTLHILWVLLIPPYLSSFICKLSPLPQTLPSFCFGKRTKLFSSSGPLYVLVSAWNTLPSLSFLYMANSFWGCSFISIEHATHCHTTIYFFFIEWWQIKEGNRRDFHRPLMTVDQLKSERMKFGGSWGWGGFNYIIWVIV